MKMTISGHKEAGSGWPKIQAIKHIRFLTDLGLKEAKDIADKLEAGTHTVTEFKPVGGKDRDNFEVQEAIKALRDIDIKVIIEMPHSEEEKELMALVNKTIHICTDIKKVDVLEVLVIAYKMLVEKE
jgi:hypothetical protein